MDASLRERMRTIYDEYFASRIYERRYPAPNRGTLRFLLRQGVASARCIADVGCGSGRYAWPVLAASAARLTACDISTAAIASFKCRLRTSPWQGRVDTFVGGVEDLPPDARFDCVLLLFGVLSHLGPRAARIETLRQLHARVTPGASLLLSVPSVWRRFPVELARARWQGGGREPGDVEYRRRLGEHDRTFYYHLFTPARLRGELAEAGWRVRAMEAESLLPESMVARPGVAGWLDGCLQPWIPAALGYGIRVAAERQCDG